jgi:hypothetical protein
LIYSAIDIVASLERSGNEGTRKTFVHWVSRYLPHDERLRCTPTELWAARCGVIHTLSADSDLSRRGKARRVEYAYGAASADELQGVLPMVGVKDVAIHVDTFLELARDGVAHFFSEVKTDPDRLRRVSGNAARCLSNLTIKEILDLERR